MTGEKKHCNHCQKDVGTVLQVLSEGTHYGRLNCEECGRYVSFVKKPNNEGKRGRNKYTPEDLKINHCQLCLRPGHRLGSRGVLDVHHVIEIQDGGDDTKENIWVVCTSCHRLIHHQRTYLNSHLKAHYSKAELERDMKTFNIPFETKEVMRRLFDKREGSDA